MLAQDGVGDAVLVEDPPPQDRRDGGGDGPRDEDRGTHHTSSSHRLVHDEGHDDAQHGLEEHGHHTEERGVEEGIPEPVTPSGEDVGIVAQTDERLGVVDESGLGVQAGLAMQGLVQRLEDRYDDDDRQDEQCGCDEEQGQTLLGPGSCRSFSWCSC